jgi:hypothetical protein
MIKAIFASRVLNIIIHACASQDFFWLSQNPTYPAPESIFLHFAFQLQHALTVILFDQQRFISFFSLSGHLIAVNGSFHFTREGLLACSRGIALAPLPLYVAARAYHKICKFRFELSYCHN